ncbi:hypothetical protein EYF80_039886 [Liparis tanakae]|uniref:Uncharacterized protein n=1 Tax=Liparis tanakae TaxID=230148 RepID=A0A4Z2G8L6_9TELE|nr:hypothetical protein EYF80_039886 [Liparis tanakae]
METKPVWTIAGVTTGGLSSPLRSIPAVLISWEILRSEFRVQLSALFYKQSCDTVSQRHTSSWAL